MLKLIQCQICLNGNWLFLCGWGWFITYNWPKFNHFNVVQICLNGNWLFLCGWGWFITYNWPKFNHFNVVVFFRLFFSFFTERDGRGKDCMLLSEVIQEKKKKKNQYPNNMVLFLLPVIKDWALSERCKSCRNVCLNSVLPVSVLIFLTHKPWPPPSPALVSVCVCVCVYIYIYVCVCVWINDAFRFSLKKMITGFILFKNKIVSSFFLFTQQSIRIWFWMKSDFNNLSVHDEW